MTKGRLFMIGASLTATILFVFNYEYSPQKYWLANVVPLVLVILSVVNFLHFTRLVAWIIFALAFFAFLVILSAFTLRWRMEEGFNPYPFYRSIIMYIAFIYVSLAQIKILGSPIPIPEVPENKGD